MHKNLCFICIIYIYVVGRIVIRSSSLDLFVATLDALEAEERQMEYKKEL